MQKVSVTQFSEFFAERFEFVENNCLDSIEGWILLCSYIDSIAGYCFGGKSSGPRFRRLLAELDIKPRLDLISIPSIRYRIAQSSSPDQRYLDFFRKHFGICTSHSWYNEYNTQCKDTSAARLKEELVKVGLPIGKELTGFIRGCEYSEMIWNFRNQAVHESLIKENLNIIPDMLVPYYANPIMALSTQEGVFRFVIPVVYLLKIARACITFLEDRLNSGNLLEKIE